MRNPQRLWGGIVLLGFGLAPLPAAWADSLFDLDVSVMGQLNASREFDFSSADSAIQHLCRACLLRDFPGIDPDNDSVTAALDFRGQPIAYGFVPNSTELFLRIEGLPINAADGSDTVRFNGQTRDESKDQLREFLRNNRYALKSLLTRLAAVSPVDPLAGNPLSLMSQRMRRDYERGFTHKVSQVWECSTTAMRLLGGPLMVAANGPVSGLYSAVDAESDALRGRDEFGVGAQLQATKVSGSDGGFLSYNLSLPLSYAVKFDQNPRHKLYVELPLSYTQTEGAGTYAVSLGLAYSFPLTDQWSLTPAAAVGATASADLGGGGGVVSYSLTSSYALRLGQYGLSIGNLVGRYSTLALKLGDIEAEADIANTVFTNGLILTGPDRLLSRNLVVEYSLSDTRITGDAVYSRWFDEAGIAVGRLKTQDGVVTDYMKGGVSLLYGDKDILGLKLNFGWRF